MPLSTFAALVDAPPKWCENALETLSLPRRYTQAVARTLGLARLLNKFYGVPMRKAYRVANQWLANAVRGRIERIEDVEVGTFAIDIPRYLSDFTVRLSAVARRRSSRKLAASDYGIDLGALRENLRLSPAERLSALDANQRMVEELRLAASRHPHRQH